MDDRLLESLGTYFTYHDLYNRFGLTFEQFIDKHQRGVWKPSDYFSH